MHINMPTPTAYPGVEGTYWDIMTTSKVEKKVIEGTISWDIDFMLGLWVTLESLINRATPIHAIPISMSFVRDSMPTRDDLFYKLMESNIKTAVNETEGTSYTEELNVHNLGGFSVIGFQSPAALLVSVS